MEAAAPAVEVGAAFAVDEAGLADPAAACVALPLPLSAIVDVTICCL